MTLFRPHRGGLVESMREVIDLPDFDALARHLRLVPTDHLVVSSYGFDARIGWNAYLVTVNGMPVGFTDGPVLASTCHDGSSHGRTND